MAYESFVGRRYLMAKKRSRVLSIITLIAVVGVALGVTALIVVLSVMGGFTADLTEKILGARAHIVIQEPDHGPLKDAGSVADEAMTVEGVVGASPFIESEVMVSSPTNLSGVIIRGIDVDRIGDVSDLLQNIEEGKLEYLRDDRELMEVVEEERRGATRELLDRLDRESKELGAPDDDEDREFEEGIAPPPDIPGMNGRDGPELPDMGPADGLPSFDDADDEEVGEEKDEGPRGGGMPSMFGDDSDELPELPSINGGSGAMPPAGDESPRSDRRARVPGLIIGTELATSLQVRLGDEVNVVTPRGEIGPTGPIPRSRPFRVVGIFYSGMYEYDANHAYTALDDAARLLDFDGATGVELRAYDVDASVEIADRLRAQLGSELDVLDWQELNSSLFFALRLERIAMFIILTFIILVASFSIVAMLIMIVIEKAREIAIMKSMGASDGGIMRIFIYQGLVIGILGAMLGLAAGLGVCYYLSAVGLPLDSEVYYISKLPVDVDSAEITAVVICAIVISFLATLYPSYKAAQLNPVEGLRHD